MTSIPSASIHEAHRREPGSVLLDVREPVEWADGHVPDAVHVPMGQLTHDTVPDGQPIYVICRSGNRSGRVVQVLVEAGVDARNVEGGMIAWEQAGLPVTR